VLQELDGEYEDLVDRFYTEGWTDGLPVILPTTALVGAMLGGRDPDVVLGNVPPQGLTATVGIVAVNAVMAGCRPEYLPLVLATVRGALDPGHNINGVTCTTHMCVSLAIVNGPQVERLGFNFGDGVFGNGTRANGAVGRALRLVLWNLGGARPGNQDKSTLSHPGEYSYCIAEDEQTAWAPLSVDRGVAPGRDAVTLFACEAPHSIVAVGTPESMLDRVRSQIVARGSNNSEYPFGLGGQMLVTFNAEQVERFEEFGWSKADVKRWLWERCMCKVRDRLESGDPYSSEVGTRDGFLARGEVWADWSDLNADVPLVPTPDDYIVVVCGGRSYFASVAPGWGPFGGFAVTEEVQ
jgi:hypothetical protein